MKTIVFVDDHDMMRRGLLSCFSAGRNWRILGEASSIEEGDALFKRLAEAGTIPDIILLDIDLKGQWGLDLAAVSRRTFSPRPPCIIVYSVFDDFAHVKAALRAGASGYVCKSQPLTDLEAAMKTAAAGGCYVPSHLAARLSAVFDLSSGFTRRERQIFDMVQLRRSNREIAGELGISLRTVENRLSDLYDKTGVHSREGLEKL
jgi:DNA-binding NarL/FixJ family response regulator